MIQQKIIKSCIFYSISSSNIASTLFNKNYQQFSLFKKISEQQNSQGSDRRSIFRSRTPQNTQQNFKKPFQNITKNKKFDQLDKQQPQKAKKQWAQYLSDDLKQFRRQHLQNIGQINKVNQFFLGIKHNTKYKKSYNQVAFDSIFKQSKIYRIDDLPFAYQIKDSQLNNQQQNRTPSKRQKYFFEKISQERLKKKMLESAIGFFKDLQAIKRSVKVQPNFQFFAHSVIKGLKDASYQFQILDQQQQKPKVFIKNMYFIKGVVATRNDNYSTDSYLINNQKLESQKLIQYILWKNQGQQYPQRQWHAIKRILVRFQTVIQMPIFFDIVHPNRALANVGVSQHQFVFEMDLTLPPKYSQFRLTEEQYIQSYRPNLEQLIITNIDNKNPFYALTFKENQKDSVLINKLI